jgi:inosose dehydratase
MNSIMDRREFGKLLAAAGASLPLVQGATRNLKIGYTCITWGTFPRGGEASATLESAVRDISTLGFHSFETFPEVIEDWDSRDALKKLIDTYKIPLRSGYIRTNLTEPQKRKENLENVIRLAKVLRKYNATFAVLAPGSIQRQGYDFSAHRANIIATLNECAMAVNDAGLGTGLHQHTGTCIESRDEVYAVMENANTKHLKFAPDVGQLQKGGADAAKVVKDFLPITVHMHLKDFKGWDHYVGYCPLGQGKVDLKSILDMMEKANPKANIMVELDPSKDAPESPLEAARTSKAYLAKLGYQFRS